jgi:hypothetical protein
LSTGRQHYTGRRVFRPSDVKSVTPVLGLLPSRDTMTLTAASKVSQWTNVTGGTNATQAVDGQRLVYTSFGGPGGKPFIAFDTAGGNLALGDYSALTAGELFAVRRVNADPPVSGAGTWYRFGTSGSTDHSPFTDGTVFDGFGSTARKNAGNPTPDLSQWHIWNVRSVASDFAILLNGAAFFSTATNTVGFHATCQLGSNSGGGIRELWLFNGKLTAYEREGMVAYLTRNNSLFLPF